MRPLKLEVRNHLAVKTHNNYPNCEVGIRKLTTATANNIAHTKKNVVVKKNFASSYIEKLETRYKLEKKMLTIMQISFSHCEQTGQ